MDLLSGRLVVATPALTEPTFARTVVLLLQHQGPDGALGVVINRPGPLPVDEVLPGWQELMGEPPVVFQGGPVQTNAAICLGRRARADAQSPYFAPLGAGNPVGDLLGTVDLDAEPHDVQPVIGQARVFAGYAGWSPGQLEGEVEEGAWWVLDALPGDAFSGAPELLWRQVLRRQGGTLALASTYPEDPSSN